MSQMHINPYTGKPDKMIKVSFFIWPEDKAKVFNEAKKAKYDGIASAVVRNLINKLK